MPEEKDDKGFKVIDRRGREEEPSPPPAPPPVETPGTGAALRSTRTGSSPPRAERRETFLLRRVSKVRKAMRGKEHPRSGCRVSSTSCSPCRWGRWWVWACSRGATANAPRSTCRRRRMRSTSSDPAGEDEGEPDEGRGRGPPGGAVPPPDGVHGDDQRAPRGAKKGRRSPVIRKSRVFILVLAAVAAGSF